MTPGKSQPWCVIGAGSSGMAVAKSLRQHGYQVQVFEQSADVGGTWNFGTPPARVYSSTHTISSKPFTEFADFPMPDRFPDYPHHTQVLEYLRAYVAHFGLKPLVTFSTCVDRIEPAGDGWDVTLSGAQNGTRRFAGVVIANGHNWSPKVPAIPGEFDGEVMHSADYKGPEVLRGKRVLVVGAGNTGCDVAVEAAGTAEQTYHSTRRGYWYAPKYSYGRPSDQVRDLMHALRIPFRAQRLLSEMTLRTSVGDLARIGMKRPDHRLFSTHPIVNSQLVATVAQGEVSPVDDVARLDGDGVVLVDGSRISVDLIVYCTGYRLRLDFIDPQHLAWDGRRPHLFLNVFPPRQDRVFIAGLIQPDSGQFKLVGWQAEAIATAIDAQRLRPDAYARFAAMRDAHVDDSLSGGARYAESTRHFFEINHYTYLRRLEQTLGVLEGSDDQRTKVMQPLLWALPPRPAEREVLAQHGRDQPGSRDDRNHAGGGRPPLLFVHGASHGAWAFEQWMAAAAERGWSSYALSLRGHGGSGGRERLPRTLLRDYTHDVLQTIAELPAPPVLIGHSMGALVVRRVLARYRPPAAVLVSPTGARHDIWTALGMLRRHPAEIARAVTGRPFRLHADDLFADPHSAEAVATERRLGLESPLTGVEVTLAPRPVQSKAPVLVLGGAADPLVHPAEFVRTARIYGATAHVFRGMGHDLMAEARRLEPLDVMLGWLDDELAAA